LQSRAQNRIVRARYSPPETPVAAGRGVVGAAARGTVVCGWRVGAAAPPRRDRPAAHPGPCHHGEPTRCHRAALWRAAPAAPTQWKEV